ncbi:polysaccharide biosynthesis protein [Paenibacillus gansuensis]|uniref:Polysaccharide biosynthesis protein n=1 Tax=Paenibacillus gansuensis TaxID=306542 RepID=A0ABW5PII3_9BACL
MVFPKRSIALLTIDLILLLVCLLISFMSNMHGTLPREMTGSFMISTIIYLLISYVSLFLSGSYKTLWRYAEIGGLMRIGRALTAASLFYFLANLIILTVAPPLEFYLMLWMSSLVTIAGLRAFFMSHEDFRKSSVPGKKRTLIVGAGEAGTLIAKQLLYTERARYAPVAFADDDRAKQKFEILGIPVAGQRADIPELVWKYRIQDIIIALPSAPKKELNDIISICRKSQVQIRILPKMQDWIQGKISVKEIRDVDMKDILGREIIQPPKEDSLIYLKDKIILVTGAGGSIGNEIVCQAAKVNPKKIILFGHGENSIHTTMMNLFERFPNVNVDCVIGDIQDRTFIADLFAKYKPDIVFHAAAHKHVPLMETNVSSAVKNNIYGTKIVAEAAAASGTDRFVFISTDKAVYPVNVMGITKRFGEFIIKSLSETSGTRYSIVRFGNVLESRGSVIPIFKKQLAAGGPITVTHPEMVRYFMTIPEAVQLVLEAGVMSEGGETFVLDMGEQVKIDHLARTFLRLAGFEPDVDIPIVYTGIRPGEKLSESLFYDYETVFPSNHPYISVARSGHIDRKRLEGVLNHLSTVLTDPKANLNEILGIALNELSSTIVDGERG